LKPILLIPVFRGGDYFRECLFSLRVHQGAFDHVIVSINGSDCERALDKTTLEQSGLDTKSVVLFETTKSLSPAAHGAFILKSIRRLGFGEETQIMNLFHDDWLLGSPKDLGLDKDVVVVGDWLTNQSAERMSATKSTRKSIQDWIEDGGSEVEFINGSGMIAPLGVRQSAAKIMSLFRTGVRYEYFLLTHKKVRYMQKSQDPLVRIRIHAGQDGQQQSSVSTLRGDLAFILWLFLQRRIRSFGAMKFVAKLFTNSLHSAAIRARRELFAD